MYKYKRTGNQIFILSEERLNSYEEAIEKYGNIETNIHAYYTAEVSIYKGEIDISLTHNCDEWEVGNEHDWKELRDAIDIAIEMVKWKNV